MKIKDKSIREKDKIAKESRLRSWVLYAKKQRLKVRDQTLPVTSIKKAKRLRCTATKKEWLRRLSYFTDPNFLPPKFYKGGACKVVSFQSAYAMAAEGRRDITSISYISRLVQKNILQHNWPAAVSLLKILLKYPLSNNYLRFLTESLYSVVLNHPLSSPELTDNFIRSTSMILDGVGV